MLAPLVLRMGVLCGAGMALGLSMNAFSSRGIPLTPVTVRTDYPPPPGTDLAAEGYLTLETMQMASDILALGAGLDDVPLGMTIVDTRSPREFREGHIPGALNVPLTLFRRGRPPQLDRVDRDNLVFVYCDDPNCGSSVIVAEQLRLHGYGRDKVQVFVGGLPAWLEAGLPLEFGNGQPDLPAETEGDR